ncbi:cytosine permease [Providencia vermicola]|uniref:Cytosine permease n=2 Tax=Providencia stuartii TaxID=588 RepID=A0AAI9I0U2_PROST|nr:MULTISPECIES: cytosine permease [Providencia]ELR5044369.1 cytosine permease [Providencia rettgeri]ELR5036545.1 cytosine permease [Providencia stuartii]ELR5120649.1 cytosine permease [Providencia stuartii]ELR5293641.1 cytosine permease [Providencia stuartii]MBG5921053.1 cytosine permease [Providencia stuartii]
MANKMGEDYSLARVPLSARRPFYEVLIIRIGSLACVSQVMLGAALGYGLTFWQAFWATMLGSVILQVVSWALGAAACREGMSISLLSRWSGFGKLGSALIGGAIAISLMGWFGVQNGFFADGMYKATNVLTPGTWSLITGIAVTIITVYGYRFLSITANISTPLFLLALVWATYNLLSGQDISVLISSAEPAGPLMTLPAAITMVAGGFIISAVTTPDISRFMKSPKEVFWMTLIGTFFGELLVNMIAVLMALALHTSQVFDLMMTLTGLVGASIVIFSTIKMNDINLYSSSLGFSTLLNAIFNKRFDRRYLTWVIGIFGTIASMLGILDNFIGFLIYLGIAIPPVAGIMVIDYYLLKRDRKELETTRAKGELPLTCEAFNPITLIVWIIAVIVGWLSSELGPFNADFGVPALNSLLASALLYWIGMRWQARIRGVDTVQFRKVSHSD